ncbi:MAG: response regulator [Fimbriimonadaceae bacterium]|nr:response regulator [Fimbriimonadaceae bacterium]
MPVRVLITDDALFMRVTLRNILRAKGCLIVGEARTGEEAVRLYRAVDPDVVTMDITMPDGNGLSALAAIRKYDPTAKVVMCTAMGQEALVMEAIRLGARDFVVKPFKPDRVVDAVVRLAA